MTDPRIPDDGETLDGLGLETLSTGVRPTTGQWSAITTTAAHRRQRRAWLLAAAAMVVLVVGTAAVVLGRSDRSDGPGFTTGGLPADTYVIPPASASVTSIDDSDPYTVVTYSTGGGSFRLIMSRTGTPPEPPAEFLNGALPVQHPTLGTVYLACSGMMVSRSGSGTAAPGAVDGLSPSDTIGVDPETTTWLGPVGATWITGFGMANLYPADATAGPCTPPSETDAALMAALDEIRVVDREGWNRFVQDHGDVLRDLRASTGTTMYGPVVPASTTTLPEDPPADRGSAVDQITAAVAAWSVPADGSFPNLEDGTAKATEYAELFDTAGKQSGAAQAGDGSGNASRLSRVRFVTPERASITMELTAKLPTGTFTFPQDGEAILQDGHWVVTYRTVTTTLRRACIPPGGYDGCPTN